MSASTSLAQQGHKLSRSDFLRQAGRLAAAGLLAPALPALANEGPVLRRPIPSSGEMIPVIGSGTAVIYDIEAQDPRIPVLAQSMSALIGGGGVTLSPRNGLLPALRSSKDEGQSNFVNPGLNLLGVGTDMDLLPELRLSTNLNRLSFVDTSSLEYLRNQGKIDTAIGWEVSAALIYRPYFTQNVVARLSGAILVPGKGLEALYDTSGNGTQSDGKLLYSVHGNLVLTF